MGTASFCGRPIVAPSACVSRRGSSKGSHAKTRLRQVVSCSEWPHSKHDVGAVLDGAGLTDCALLVSAWSAIAQLGRSRKQMNPFLVHLCREESRPLWLGLVFTRIGFRLLASSTTLLRREGRDT